MFCCISGIYNYIKIKLNHAVWPKLLPTRSAYDIYRFLLAIPTLCYGIPERLLLLPPQLVLLPPPNLSHLRI